VGPKQDPDLFFMGLLTRFAGYYPGYSDQIRESRDHLSWVILKAHTLNRAGTVTLRSGSPVDPPLVNFHYFDAGDDPSGVDARAVVEGIRFVRSIADQLRKDRWIGEEESPGAHVTSDDALAAFVRDNAWGHHASCSCAIGPREANGVLSSDFEVHGIRGLRVVDASVFPRIPGFFIVSAILMIGEKAADAILRTARAAGAVARV
jgi:choline dehydrogenase-like flavoprotein